MTSYFFLEFSVLIRMFFRQSCSLSWVPSISPLYLRTLWRYTNAVIIIIIIIIIYEILLSCTKISRTEIKRMIFGSCKRRQNAQTLREMQWNSQWGNSTTMATEPWLL